MIFKGDGGGAKSLIYVFEYVERLTPVANSDKYFSGVISVGRTPLWKNLSHVAVRTPRLCMLVLVAAFKFHISNHQPIEIVGMSALGSHNQ